MITLPGQDLQTPSADSKAVVPLFLQQRADELIE
jgi:hypothetical protein